MYCQHYLVAYLPSVRTYSWNVPGAVKPEFSCLGQCSSSVPLVQNSHRLHVLTTHLTPALSPGCHRSCTSGCAWTTSPAPSWPATPHAESAIFAPKAAHSSCKRDLSEAQRPVQLILTRICPESSESLTITRTKTETNLGRAPEGLQFV